MYKRKVAHNDERRKGEKPIQLCRSCHCATMREIRSAVTGAKLTRAKGAVLTDTLVLSDAVTEAMICVSLLFLHPIEGAMELV